MTGLTRRELAAGALALGAATVLGCGGDEPAGEEGTGTSIDRAYGTTEAPASPRRVVTVGFNEQDFALALGVTPIAVREWYGDRPDATWSWARDELGDAHPEVLPETQLNFEQIARLRPDLILGIYSGMTEQDYDALSRIAPTVPQSGDYDDFGVPWQQQLRVTGRALGRDRRAQRVVDAVEARFAGARERNPRFDGMTAAVGYANPDGGFGVYSSQDSRARFMSSLGFDTPPEIDELTGDGVGADISGERFRLLDQDVLLLFEAPGTSRERIESSPLFQRLDAAREDRVLIFGEVAPLSGALSFSSPLSLPVALDAMVPRLASL